MKTEALQAGARQVRLRRRLRRRAPRRGEAPRQGAHLLVPHRAAPLGPEEPAPGAVEPLQHAHRARARASASSRCRTGPSSTSGSTSTSRTSRSCRSTSPSRAPGRRARRHADHGRRRPHAAASPARQPLMRMVRFRTLGCYPLTGAIESDGRRRCRRSSRRCCSPRTSERQGRLIDHDEAGLDGEEEAGGLFLMTHAAEPDRARTSTRTCTRTSTRACCASSPAARSTTASRR